MRELEYPFDAEGIIKNLRTYRKRLLASIDAGFMKKRIAILGGQTTHSIRQVLELFLLNYGIEPEFYESEYNQYYEDGMFPNSELEHFSPDLIYVCTCIRNIPEFPLIADDKAAVQEKKQALSERFYRLWDRLTEQYHCPIIQNNFEYPLFRLLGNKDASDYHGRVHFVTSMNESFYAYAEAHEDFYICDINYISATYGLDKWSDPYYWHLYKYAVSVPAIPYLAYNVAAIIKSIYGKNKKAFNIDLDNTLWGGTIGDDGAENLEIGKETPMAQAYSEFQEYLKLHKQLGVIMTVNSKNDEKTALLGFERPDSVLKSDDFISFKVNWEPKNENLLSTARELNLLPESFVFLDDNPAERAIIRDSFPGAGVPEISEVEQYIRMIDRSAYFEVTQLSQDDLKRNEMYQENLAREKYQASFIDYEEYLKSLKMKGEIRSFIPMFYSRIAQLTNKSNQFNLTTKRFSQSDIETIAADPQYITLYGRLEDRFGDNGVVSVIIGRVQQDSVLDIELWLMSCRVLKRKMEYAMMDELAAAAKSRGIRKMIGHYYPTSKNAMVRDFYSLQGFQKVSEDEPGNTTWELDITDSYEKKQNVIEIIQKLQ